MQLWLDHVEAAATNFDLSYVFVVDPDDIELINIIPESSHKVYVRDDHDEDVRDWHKKGRFAHMANLRNALLGEVRKLAPDYFLSLDSDILIPPGYIDNLVDTLESNPCIAVGGKAFMTPGVAHPSYANINSNGNLLRQDHEGIIKVDVIMAAKLMSPAAYNVDYVDHKQGEDIGWSIAARAHGKLYWDGRMVAKHVHLPKYLDRIDSRAGF